MFNGEASGNRRGSVFLDFLGSVTDWRWGWGSQRPHKMFRQNTRKSAKSVVVGSVEGLWEGISVVWGTEVCGSRRYWISSWLNIWDQLVVPKAWSRGRIQRVLHRDGTGGERRQKGQVQGLRGEG